MSLKSEGGRKRVQGTAGLRITVSASNQLYYGTIISCPSKSE